MLPVRQRLTGAALPRQLGLEAAGWSGQPCWWRLFALPAARSLRGRRRRRLPGQAARQRRRGAGVGALCPLYFKPASRVVMPALSGRWALMFLVGAIGPLAGGDIGFRRWQNGAVLAASPG